MKWSYGVTTVPSRKDSLLPITLASLKAGGFDVPRLFVDGAKDGFEAFGLETTYRFPTIRTHGNWVLSLYELYIREPAADRYAVFQDDFVTCKNLRAYLESSRYPDKSYLNLYTFPANQLLCPRDLTVRREQKVGWYPSNQFGRGAVALVFNRDAVLTLLASPHLTSRPMDCTRGHRAIDGGIVDSFRKADFREYVHNPSLVQHIGAVSSMGNPPHLQAMSFRGEDFDARDLRPEL